MNTVSVSVSPDASSWDAFIKGIPLAAGQAPQSVDDLRVMKWVNKDLENLTGRRIHEISDEIQRHIDQERNKPGVVLVKALYYLTAAVAVGVLAAVIVELGLVWAGVASATLIKSTVFLTIGASAGSLLGLFDMMHRTNMVDTRMEVQERANKEWPNERTILREASNKQDLLLQIHTRAKTLQMSSPMPSDAEQQSTINASIVKIEAAMQKVAAKITFLNALPSLPRYILLR